MTSSVINEFTCSAYSAQLLPGCVWIFGNLYMHVGKSIFMSPWLVGFTWYMGMMSDSRKINTNTIRERTSAMEFGRLPYYPCDTKARAEGGRVSVTSRPPKVKVQLLPCCFQKLILLLVFILSYVHIHYTIAIVQNMH